MLVSIMDWEFAKGITVPCPILPRQTQIMHETGQVVIYLCPVDEEGKFIPGQDIVLELPPEAYKYLAAQGDQLLGFLMSLGKGSFSGKNLDFSSIKVTDWSPKVSEPATEELQKGE